MINKATTPAGRPLISWRQIRTFFIFELHTAFISKFSVDCLDRKDMSRMRVALTAKDRCHDDAVQDGSVKRNDNMTSTCANNEKGFVYYWNLTTIYPKKKKLSCSRRKSYAFKRNKSDASSSSSSTSQMEESERSQDEMEIYRGCYV